MKKIIISVLFLFLFLVSCGANPGSNNNSNPSNNDVDDNNKNDDNNVQLDETVSYCHYRLENADISFNYDMSSSKSTKTVSLKENNTTINDDELVEDYSKFIYDNGGLSFNSTDLNNLNNLKEWVMRIVDTAINRITVLDKCVLIDMSELLGY